MLTTVISIQTTFAQTDSPTPVTSSPTKGPTRQPTRPPTLEPTLQPSLANATGDSKLGFFDDETNVLIMIIAGGSAGGFLLLAMALVVMRRRLRRRPRIVMVDPHKLQTAPSAIFGVESIETSVRESRRNSYYLSKDRWSVASFFRSFRRQNSAINTNSIDDRAPLPPPKFPRSATIDSESQRGNGILRQMSSATTDSTFSEEESASQAPRYTRKYTLRGMLRRNFSLESYEY